MQSLIWQRASDRSSRKCFDRSSKFVPVLTSLFLLGSRMPLAQNGSIAGQVTDPQGKAISGAAVQVVNQEGTFERDTKTDASGAYSVPDLPPGLSGRGRRRRASNRIHQSSPQTLAAGQALVFNSKLASLKSRPATLWSRRRRHQRSSWTRATISGTISNTEVTNLRPEWTQLHELVTTTPGVSNQTGQDEAKVGVAGSAKFSVNGGRVEYNTYEVDGSDVLNTEHQCQPRSGRAADCLPQHRRHSGYSGLTSNYGAMYGKTASGSVIVTTKSGGAQFHGNLYGFIRNEMFNARNYFDQPGRTPLYRRQDYGGTIGGPLFIPNRYNTKKDKTFFFFSEELRLEKTPVTYNQAVPTVAERSGTSAMSARRPRPTEASTILYYKNPDGSQKYPDCPVVAPNLEYPQSLRGSTSRTPT